MTLALRLAALLECLAAADRDGGEENAMRFAEGASLLAAAARPQLRVGTLTTVTLAQSLRTLALTLESRSRSERRRLLAEAAMSAGLGWLLHRSASLARWDR
ncbi:MAG TPA: hypothetical protein VHG69_05475 [Thermoleophilaceae bacterium]|nr:hypothetical protein [Thermoleophilaceae bacterium]